MKSFTYILLLSLFLACTNASLLDFIRLKRKRRQYSTECCMPPTVMTCCPDNSGAMMAAAPASVDLNSMDEESRDMYNAWNAPVKLGVFINPEATPDDSKASKRAETPFHQNEGSGSGSGGSYFTSDSAKRDEVPKPKVVKQENVKKSTIETIDDSKAEVEAKEKTNVESNEKKSELSAKASEIEEVQGGTDKEKRQSTITCQGQKDWLQCPTYQLIKIKDAFWGRDDEKTCSRSHTERSLQTTKMCAQDESNTMAKLQNACDGESACELVASPVYFDRTDCSDVYKFLRVNWECAHSESRIKA